MGKINVHAVAENVSVTLDMQKQDLQTLRGILTLAEQKLKDWQGMEGLSELKQKQLKEADDLIGMIRGAILPY